MDAQELVFGRLFVHASIDSDLSADLKTLIDR